MPLRSRVSWCCVLRLELSYPFAHLSIFDELARLSELEQTSLPELVNYLRMLPMDIPREIMDLRALDAPAAEERKVLAHRNAVNSSSGDVSSLSIVGDVFCAERG